MLLLRAPLTGEDVNEPLLGFGDVVAERGASSDGRVDESGVVMFWNEFMRRAGSLGEAIVDIFGGSEVSHRANVGRTDG